VNSARPGVTAKSWSVVRLYSRIYRRPDLNAASFKDVWLRNGDLDRSTNGFSSGKAAQEHHHRGGERFHQSKSIPQSKRLPGVRAGPPSVFLSPETLATRSLPPSSRQLRRNRRNRHASIGSVSRWDRRGYRSIYFVDSCREPTAAARRSELSRLLGLDQPKLAYPGSRVERRTPLVWIHTCKGTRRIVGVGADVNSVGPDERLFPFSRHSLTVRGYHQRPACSASISRFVVVQDALTVAGMARADREARCKPNAHVDHGSMETDTHRSWKRLPRSQPSAPVLARAGPHNP